MQPVMAREPWHVSHGNRNWSHYIHGDGAEREGSLLANLSPSLFSTGLHGVELLRFNASLLVRP